MNSLPRLTKAFSASLYIGLFCILVAGTQIGLWAMDREPPFYTVEATAIPTPAGQPTTIKATVHRDLTRRCNVVYSRFFFDSKGVRYDLMDSPQTTNAKGLDDLQRRMPNELRFGITIPLYAAKGTGSIVTTLDYECNPVHKFYPIPVIMTVNVDVL